MADVSKLEKELQEATGVKPKAKEKRNDYLVRLNSAVGELPDDDWKALSTPAQKWTNAATKAFDGDKTLPDFDEADEPKATKAKGKAVADDGDPADDETTSSEEDGDAEDPAENEDTVSSKPTKKAPAKKADAKKPAAKAAPAKEAKAPKAKAEKKASKPRGAGGVHAVLEYVLKKPDDSVADIVVALEKDGITVTNSTVSSARGFFKLVARFLGSKKLLTKKLFEE